jgi:hypothetical protein
MARYCFKTDESTNVKKLLCKIGETKVNTQYIRGTVTFTGYRKYTSYCEVDIEFNGQILARIRREPAQWLSSEILKEKRASKIKVNRFIRKCIFKDVESRLKYFSSGIHHYSSIKKLKWI